MSEFIQSLPIASYLAEITAELHHNPRCILQAEPGAGKSTAVPLHLLQQLELANKTILILEPRRLAAKSIAHFLAKSLGESVGQTVGYHIRNERKVGSQTRLEIITEGVLTARLQQDPELTEVGLVIFDEFHERSIHSDLGLALCLEVQEGFNEDLKILIMSATLDIDSLQDYLGTTRAIQVPGRCFPVQTHYLGKQVQSAYRQQNGPQFCQKSMLRSIDRALKNGAGDVLVFLPGRGEIESIKKTLLADWQAQQLEQKYVVCPLYSGLSSEQQEIALIPDKSGRQKVVLATNIAETSLTIANITAVVDSGLEKQALYDPSSGMNRLLTQRISKASAEQRCGRAGRLQAGDCYRLWSESMHAALAEQSVPEISRTDLAPLRLIMATWGVKDSQEIAWLTAPPQAHYDAATDLLQNLQLLDAEQKLSGLGEQAARLSLHPRLTRILLQVEDAEPELQQLAVELVAVLTDPHFYQDRDDADLLNRLLALHAYERNPKQALQQYAIKPGVIRLVQQTVNKLFKAFVKSTQKPRLSLSFMQQHLGGLLRYGYPDRIAKKRVLTGASSANKSMTEWENYLLANGKGAQLKSLDKLSQAEWLVVADLDGASQSALPSSFKGSAANGRIFLAAELSAEVVAEYPGFTYQAEYEYLAKEQKIVAREVTSVGAIKVKKMALKNADTAKWQACLLTALDKSNLQLINLNSKTQAWLQRVRWLQAVSPNETADWPDFSEQGLLATKTDWLQPYLGNIDSMSALNKLDVEALIKARLGYEESLLLEQHAPAFYKTPRGKQIAIDYTVGELPKISIVLQELFGEQKSPALAFGHVNLSFELLSPAQRPIQTTSDLASFWTGSYKEVAKEMKGRYPKHRWPENPLDEKAGHSLKSRT